MKYYVRAEVWGFIDADNEDEAVDELLKHIDYEAVNGDFDIDEIEEWSDK